MKTTHNGIAVKYCYPPPLEPWKLYKRQSCSPNLTCSANNLIRTRKAAFITETGLYKNRVMLYWLANAPSIFQGIMNETFQKHLHSSVCIYTDNILIFTYNLSEHNNSAVEKKLECISIALNTKCCRMLISLSIKGVLAIWNTQMTIPLSEGLIKIKTQDIVFTQNVVISVDASQAEGSGRIFCCLPLHRLETLKT